MQPRVEKIEKPKNESFVVGHYKEMWFERSWHYHSEYELLLVTRGFGTRIIGDNTSRFNQGDLVLLGGDVPHAWFSDPVFFQQDNKMHCESIYIHFNRSIFGNKFAELPEMKAIQLLLNRARLGLFFTSGDKDEVIREMHNIIACAGIDRLLKLIHILKLFQEGSHTTLLSESYFQGAFMTRSARLKKVHEYVMNNFSEDINCNKAAERVGMNVSAFCRYFKKMTCKTFSQYVRETRIDYAQQLLINTSLSSSEVCFESGFSSAAYFNQCFKSFSNMTPLEYRSMYKVV